MRPIQATQIWLLPVALAWKLVTALPAAAPDLSISEHQNDVLVQLSVPCHGCSHIEDDDLLLNLRLRASHKICADDHVLINGNLLEQAWDGNTAEGAGPLQSILSESLIERLVDARWKSFCVASGQDGEYAQILSLSLDSQPGLVGRAGFTLAFEPGREPTILRVGHDATEMPMDETVIDSWVNPSTADQFKPNPPSQQSSISALQLELEELHTLKKEALELHFRIQEKKKHIKDYLKQDLTTFKAKLNKCDSVRCLWENVTRKIPQVARSIASYFQRPMNSSVIDEQSHLPMKQEIKVDETLLEDILNLSALNSAPVCPGHRLPHDDADGSEHVSEPVHDEHHIRPQPPHSERPPAHSDHFSPSTDRPFSHHDARPTSPAEKTHSPEGDYDLRPPADAQPSIPTEHYGVSASSDIPSPPQQGPEDPKVSPAILPSPHQQHESHHFWMLALSIILAVILAAFAFKFVCHLVLSPQRRADHAFRREERRTRRAYRRAARRHRLAQWWSRYRNPPSQEDCEEKGAHIVEQDVICEDVMQAEIRDLRRTHELVGEMVRAREGRDRLYRLASTTPYQTGLTPAELEAGVGSSSLNAPDLSRESADLPPPRYSEDLHGDLRVVDGFMYTPSATDETPESSVVDCSPRLSLETSRTRASSDVSGKINNTS